MLSREEQSWDRVERQGEREGGMKMGTKCSTGRPRGVAWRVYPDSSSRHPLERSFMAATAPSLDDFPPFQPTLA